MKKRVLYFFTIVVISSMAFVACIEENKEIWNTEGVPEMKITVSASAIFGIKIEIAGQGEMKINWGDDSPFETDTLKNKGVFYAHKYKSTATYTICIIGDIDYFNCSNCNVTNIDVSKHPALSILNCSGNSLTSIDVSNNTELLSLDCGGNNLTNLDLKKNSALLHLFCGGNRITNLDLSKLPNLLRLDCNGNRLTNISVGYCKNLYELDCRGNQLLSLNVSGNSKLAIMDCSWNGAGTDKLSNLDMSSNGVLVKLKCCSNGFSASALNALFESLHSLPYVYIDDKTVDISGNPGSKACDKQIAKDKGWRVIY